MSRFYFHIHDGRDLLDTDGSELPDEATARIEALRLTGEVLRDEAKYLVHISHWSMAVTDASGSTVYQVDVSFRACRTAAPMAETPQE